MVTTWAHLSAVQIDILVVNCSLFNPTPSLSAMIVNHFKMRSNTITYNLGGMGCSAGVIAIGLAREQLQVCPGDVMQAKWHGDAGRMAYTQCTPGQVIILADSMHVGHFCGCVTRIYNANVQVYPNSTALVVSTENITQNWYFGEDRSMLIPNCLFRIGGAAIVLSNKCVASLLSLPGLLLAFVLCLGIS